MTSYFGKLRHQHSHIASLPRAKALALVLVLIVPGGLVVPACYAVYHAIRHTLTK